MATFDGSGALGALGENPIPQGTPDELRAAGLDVAKVGSCAPPSHGVRGCQFESMCIFGQARYGGFKDKGPRYVGYSLITVEGSGKRDTIPCHGFIRSLLYRMRAGDAARAEGKPHESIRIIAQEGETIEINPMEQVDPSDRKQTAIIKRNPHTIQVQRHLRPGENPQITYDQRLWAEEQIRQRYDPEFAQPMNQPVFADDDALDLGSPASTGSVVAEPVEKPSKK